MKPRLIAVLGTVSALALAVPAGAQQQETEAQAQDSQCIQELQQLAQTLREDGYWLFGYRGFGTVGMAPTARGTTPAAPGAAPIAPEQPAGEFAVRPDPADPSVPAEPPAPGVAGPWGAVTWEQRPQYEIGVLYEAAFVLGNVGDEETCMRLAQATADRYESYIAELDELGIEPQQVTDWRRAEIAASEPVTEIDIPFRAESLIGMNVRNAEDENLGSVGDVMLDPATGEVRYVTVDHGGLFGIGADEVVVPWEHLRVTPGLNAFVLPVDRQTLEQAPAAPDTGLLDQQQTGAIDVGEVDSYWEQTQDAE